MKIKTKNHKPDVFLNIKKEDIRLSFVKKFNPPIKQLKKFVDEINAILVLQL